MNKKAEEIFHDPDFLADEYISGNEVVAYIQAFAVVVVVALIGVVAWVTR